MLKFWTEYTRHRPLKNYSPRRNYFIPSWTKKGVMKHCTNVYCHAASNGGNKTCILEDKILAINLNRRLIKLYEVLSHQCQFVYLKRINTSKAPKITQSESINPSLNGITSKGSCRSWKKIVKSLDEKFFCFSSSLVKRQSAIQNLERSKTSKRDSKCQRGIRNVHVQAKTSKHELKSQSASQNIKVPVKKYKCQPKR